MKKTIKQTDKKYTFTSSWGKKYTIIFVKGQYSSNNTLAIQMICVDSKGMEEPFATLTVNIEDSDVYATKADRAFIDTNNLGSGVTEWLEKNGIAKDTGIIGFSGYCTYPMYKFTEEALASMRTM